MSNKSVSARFFELYGGQHDVEACTVLFAGNAVIYWNSLDRAMDLDTYKQLGYSYLVGVPDMQVNHVLWGGTNTGVLNGMPATGRAFRNEAVVIDRFAGGVIVERREIGDLLGMMQQLGLIPGPQAA
jgi:hypothetical protein